MNETLLADQLFCYEMFVFRSTYIVTLFKHPPIDIARNKMQTDILILKASPTGRGIASQDR